MSTQKPTTVQESIARANKVKYNRNNTQMGYALAVFID